MANGRVRSVLDTGYDTTLADFLDKIPQFFLQQQQLKDAREERVKDREFQEKKYENTLTQQGINNDFRQEQADANAKKGDFDSFINLINGMDGGAKLSTFNKLIENNPKFSDFSTEAYAEAYKLEDSNYKKFDNLTSQFKQFSTYNLNEKFDKYSDIKSLQEKLKNSKDKTNSAAINKMFKEVTNEINFLESKSGKPFMDKDIPDNLQDQLGFVKSARTSAYNNSQALERKLSSYANVSFKRNNKGEIISTNFTMKPFPGTVFTTEPTVIDGFTLPPEVSSNEEAWKRNFETSKGAYIKSMQQFAKKDNDYKNFYKNKNLLYPKLNVSAFGTLEQPKELKATVLDDTETGGGTVDNNDVIGDKQAQAGLNNPELGMQILGYLENPTSENLLSFKDGVLQEGEYANLLKQFNELDDEGNPSITILGKEDDGIPENWKIGAGTNQIAVDDRERETIVDDASSPAQDFVEGEDKISSILSPVTAGTRSETADRDPSQYKKDIDLAKIFPKALVSKENYNLSDIAKGGKETGAVRRYANKGLGENLKSYITLSNVLSQYREGDVFNKKQTSSRIKSLEEKIKSEVGNYINPETGEFKDATYTNRIYDRLQERYFPNLSLREIKDLLRNFSTAKTMSKKSKAKFTAN